MEFKTAKEVLNSELPLSTRAHFVPTIKRAYSMVNAIINQNEFLNWKVGKDIMPLLRRVAVEFEFKKLIDSNKFPITYKIAPNAIENCRHLELLTKKSIVTISQVRDEKRVPRKAIYRNNLSLHNQMGLFEFPGDEPKEPDDPYYIILTYGGYSKNDPEFIKLGIPSPLVREWIYQIDLLVEPYIMLTPEENIITEESLVALKKEVQEKGVLQDGEAK